ncbi:uncharacterized protein PAC_07168 [Phialocephala subalpina]|uniref:Uncharacterized protein n=1 Tax=Phialocephala subalpina TaxID=576137 RepID=A0A1L7WWZ1_9HELO|nr:uncharacterized protein PAC_07168 [Phialocephala subalpina]
MSTPSPPPDRSGNMRHTTLICQLYSVPFSIGRTRTFHEPEACSWDSRAFLIFEQDPSSSLCSVFPKESGCRNVRSKGGDMLQHVAGEGCVFEAGYGGYRLGVMGMYKKDRCAMALFVLSMRAQEDCLAKSFEENYGAEILEVSDGIDPKVLAFAMARMDKKHLDTDWLQVYKRLRVMEKGVLGVRNRVRVWKVVEDVVGRIEEMAERAAFAGTGAGGHRDAEGAIMIVQDANRFDDGLLNIEETEQV